MAAEFSVSDQAFYNWHRQATVDRGLEPGLTPGEKDEIQR